MDDDMEAMIARDYGFRRIEHIHWTGSNASRILGRLRADGQEFVVRAYADATSAKYQTEFVCWLESVGINVESIRRTLSGDAFSQLKSTGETIALHHRYSDPTMSITFEADDARAWGRLVAAIHSACRRWHPSVSLRCKFLRTDPAITIDRALGHAIPWCNEVLRKFGPDIISTCKAMDAERFQPIHGDLWPGNVLKGPNGLRAIDFGESGEGPRAMDLATALRWMPWRGDTMAAEMLWRTWLSGYREVHDVSDVELSSVPALACLQHISWLVDEADVPGAKGSANKGYIEDHCSAIKAIMKRAG